MRYRLEVRIGPPDVGQRVVVRWRRPAAGNRDELADVLGTLLAADDAALTVRTAAGDCVVIPVERTLAGKVVPSAPPRRGRPADGGVALG